MGPNRYLAALPPAVLAFAFVSAAARAQLHEQSFGRYVVRAQVVHSMAVAPEILERYKLRSAADLALLDVVVLKMHSAPPATVRAYVFASAREPSGESLDIEMDPIAANDRVSFVGAVPVAAHGVTLQFTITVFPEDDTGLTMHFSETVYRHPPS